MWRTCDVCTAEVHAPLSCRPAMGRPCQSRSGRPRYGAPSRRLRACLFPSCAGRCASTLPWRCHLLDKDDACLTSRTDASLPLSIRTGLPDARMSHARQLLLLAWCCCMAEFHLPDSGRLQASRPALCNDTGHMSMHKLPKMTPHTADAGRDSGRLV